MEFLSEGPVTFQDIRKETEKDVVLKRVIHRLQNGWNSEDSCSELAPYSKKKTELIIESGAILWGR